MYHGGGGISVSGMGPNGASTLIGEVPSQDSAFGPEVALNELAEWICKFVEKVGTENALPEASIVQIKNKVDSMFLLCT